MSDELMSTREVAVYLGIHEKQVYHLVKAGKLPATRLSGKWLFPRRVLDRWLEDDARNAVRRPGHAAHPRGVLLAAGSDDPLLVFLQSALRRARPDFCLFTAPTGSTAGLRALEEGRADLAWSHLHDPAGGESTTPFLADLVPDVQAVVVGLFTREVGLVAAPGNPLRLRGVADLARPGVRLVNRQGGSGTRVLLDGLLATAGIDGERLSGYDQETCTHQEVAWAVAGGEADAGIATRSAATPRGLSFLPLASERFDMVLDRETYFSDDIQSLLEFLDAPTVRGAAGRLGGYDFAALGRLIHPRP